MSELIVPQAWATRYAPLPDGWWETHGLGLQRVWPECAEVIDRVARDVGIDPRLLVTRMELEQGAVSREWRGEVTNQYAVLGRPDSSRVDVLRSDGVTPLGLMATCDLWSLYYLCGVDKTDAGPRAGGWFGPERQCYGAALRFRYWYRGDDGARTVYDPIGEGLVNIYAERVPEWRNWLGLQDVAAYAPGVPVTRGGETIVPANQASADCLRYTTSLAGSRRLAEIGRAWFSEDYLAEENPAGQPSTETPERTDGTMPDKPTIRETNLTFVRALRRRTATRQIVVHHSDSNGGDAAAFHRYHIEHNGWAGVAYHFVILTDGTIEAARPEQTVGGHCLGHNEDTIGVCVVGKLDSAEPTNAQVASLTALLAWLLDSYGREPEAVVGHRDLNSTACPGRYLYPRLRDIRNALRDGKTLVPTPSIKDLWRIGDSGASPTRPKVSRSVRGPNSGSST